MKRFLKTFSWVFIKGVFEIPDKTDRDFVPRKTQLSRKVIRDFAQ